MESRVSVHIPGELTKWLRDHYLTAFGFLFLKVDQMGKPTIPAQGEKIRVSWSKRSFSSCWDSPSVRPFTYRKSFSFLTPISQFSSGGSQQVWSTTPTQEVWSRTTFMSHWGCQFCPCPWFWSSNEVWRKVENLYCSVSKGERQRTQVTEAAI